MSQLFPTFIPRSEFLGPSSSGSESFSSSKSMIPKPSKLNRLKYAGFSAEFLDRVEPNGNILDKDAPGKIRECRSALNNSARKVEEYALSS